MNKLISKFNLYDHFGYVFVGLYQIISLFIFVSIVQSKEFPDLSIFIALENSIGLIMTSYFVGHLVQGLSNFFDKLVNGRYLKKLFKNLKSENEKKVESKKQWTYITDKAQNFFELPQSIKQNQIFKYCQLYALSNDFSGHVRLFNSMYSLYRGFFTSTLLNLLTIIIFWLNTWILNQFTLPQVPGLFYWFILSQIFLCWIFKNRKNRFWDYMGEKTLITFDILSKKLIK
ncbi:hypothetical protein GF376_04120 [Candidatus Peregrinibacteria bacterium]|nr:hypothetical protein [Candidatus Peregrinibacteria bacterium]